MNKTDPSIKISFRKSSVKVIPFKYLGRIVGHYLVWRLERVLRSQSYTITTSPGFKPCAVGLNDRWFRPFKRLWQVWACFMLRSGYVIFECWWTCFRAFYAYNWLNRLTIACLCSKILRFKGQIYNFSSNHLPSTLLKGPPRWSCQDV